MWGMIAKCKGGVWFSGLERANIAWPIMKPSLAIPIAYMRVKTKHEMLQRFNKSLSI